MQEQPGEFLVEPRGAGVERQAFVSKQDQAVADPPPFFPGGGHQRGEVVGHVPGVIGPDGRRSRLEFGNPVGELDELEVAAFVLQGAGAHPEDVRQDAAEAAEGDGGEGDGRGQVLRGRGQRQAGVFPLAEQAEIQRAGEGEGRQGDEQEEGDNEK